MACRNSISLDCNFRFKGNVSVYTDFTVNTLMLWGPTPIFTPLDPQTMKVERLNSVAVSNIPSDHMLQLMFAFSIVVSVSLNCLTVVCDELYFIYANFLKIFFWVSIDRHCSFFSVYTIKLQYGTLLEHHLRNISCRPWSQLLKSTHILRTYFALFTFTFAVKLVYLD